MSYHDALMDQFKGESDRAAVILSASIVDEALRAFLVAKLVPVSSGTDDLFDGANAPLGTFSSRIEMAYRIGLLSHKFSRDLHLIRKIRNDFAHNVQGCSFTDTKVRSRVSELSHSNGIVERSRELVTKRYGSIDCRIEFLESVSWMIWFLEQKAQIVEALAPAEVEWGYRFSYGDHVENDEVKKSQG